MRLYSGLTAGAVLGAYLLVGAANLIAHPLSKYSFRKAEIKDQAQVQSLSAPYRFASLASGDLNLTQV